jgi:hypothetical protein
MLRRFFRGKASADGLQVIARRLDLTREGDICDRLSFSPRDFRQIAIEPPRLARQIGLYLRGGLGREPLFMWVSQLHRIVTSRTFEASGTCTPAVSNTLRLLSVLLDPNLATPADKLRASLLRIHAWLATDRPVPLRAFLPKIFRAMAPLHLNVLQNPLAFSLDRREQWLDVGIIAPDDKNVRLIPFSVFTRNFFRKELPAMIARVTEEGSADWARRDSFYYHPENNQAIALQERYSALRSGPVGFQYFIDESGLAEIILDTKAIRRQEVLFASKLFCLQNRVRRATLNGRVVPLAAR